MRTPVLMLTLAALAAPALAEREATNIPTSYTRKSLANNPHDAHARCHTSLWRFYSECQAIRDSETAQYKSEAKQSPTPVVDETGAVTTGRRSAYNRSALTGTTSETTYSAYAWNGRFKPLFPLTPAGASAQPAFEANGATINSCNEYAYKRYYHANRHLDALGQLAVSNRFYEAVNVVLDGAPAIGDAKALSPATGYLRDYDNRYLTTWNGTFTGFTKGAITAPRNQNPFYVLGDLELMAESLPWPNEAWVSGFGAAIHRANARTDNPSKDTWEFARSMKEAAAIKGLSPAERDDIADRVDRMRSTVTWARDSFHECLVDDFKRTTASVAVSYPGNVTFNEYVSAKLPGFGLNDPVPTYELGLQARLVGDQWSAVLDQVVAADLSTNTLYASYARTPTGQLLRKLAAVSLAYARSAVANTRTTFASYSSNRCNAGFIEIARLLVEEHQRGEAGCMGNHIKCEFSMPLFVRDVAAQIASHVSDIDEAKQSCLTYIGPNFNSFSSFVTPANRASVTAFETYFKGRKQQIEVALRDTPRNSSLPESIGDRRGGGTVFGDKASFAAEYKYSAEWAVNPIAKTDTDNDGTLDAVCRIGGQVEGSLVANVTAFGIDRSLVDVGLKARTEQPLAANPADQAPLFEAHVNLLGIDVFRSAPSDPLLASYTKENTDSFDIPIVRTTVLLGILPVTVEAGVGFDYGYTLEAKFATSPCQKEPFMKLSGNVTPFAGADAFLGAYVELFVASVGVKVDLTLIEAKLPFTASLTVKKDATDNYVATAKSNVDLQLTELAGAVSFVVKVLFVPVWEGELFRWSGFRQVIPLWKHDVEFPFSAFELL